MDDSLGPLVLTKTDSYERKHQPLKNARKNKRCNINVLSTTVKQDERLRWSTFVLGDFS